MAPLNRASANIVLSVKRVNVLMFLVVTFAEANAEWNESYLIRQVLLKDYDPIVRPVKNASQPVYLSMSIGIKNFIELDMKKQTLVSFGWLTVSWYDENLTWDPQEHPVTSVYLATEMVWLPELVVFNTIGQLDELESQKMKVIVEHDGMVTWYPGGLFQTFCAIDISHYPVDTQTCSVDIISWSLEKSRLNGTFDTPAFEISSTENHPEWELVGTEATYSLRFSEYWVMSFKFKLKRKVLFYVMNVILPIVLLSLMNCLVFILPVESGEKMTVCITVFLSFAVFMTLISDTLPQNSDSLCLFSAYVAAQMFLSVCSIVMATVIVSIFDHDKPHDTRSSPLSPASSKCRASDAFPDLNDELSLMTNSALTSCDTPAAAASTTNTNPAAGTANSLNPFEHAATGTVNSSGGPMHKGVNVISENVCPSVDEKKVKRSLSAFSVWRRMLRFHTMTPYERRELSRALDKTCFVLTFCVNIASSVVFIFLVVGPQ